MNWLSIKKYCFDLSGSQYLAVVYDNSTAACPRLRKRFKTIVLQYIQLFHETVSRHFVWRNCMA